jgi:hypothetical protein
MAGIRCLAGVRDLSLLHSVHTQPHIQWVPRDLFPVLKLTTHLHPLLRPRMVELYLHSPKRFHGMYLLPCAYSRFTNLNWIKTTCTMFMLIRWNSVPWIDVCGWAVYHRSSPRHTNACLYNSWPIPSLTVGIPAANVITNSAHTQRE